jgi:hypothetical protein
MHYAASGTIPTTRIVSVGGLPMYPYYIQPTILLLPENNSVRYTFKASCTQQKVISGFSIELRSGYNNFTGPCERVSFNTSEGILLLDKKVYSVVGVTEAHKKDYTEILENNVVNLFFTAENFEENEIRVVLTWTGDADLDLRSSFALNDEFDCEVYFGNKLCGSSRLSANSNDGVGGEEIVLKKVLPYHYLFYVKEYRAGKSRLVNSLAALKVYVKGYDFPVVRVYEQNKYQYEVDSDEFKIWMGFCMDGRKGVVSVAPLQAFVSVNSMKNAKKVCREFYGEQQWTSGKVEASANGELPNIKY